MYHSSPGLDLNYFIYTSPTIEVREIKRDEIIKKYHSSLSDTLKKNKFNPKKIPSLDDIQQEVKNFRLYGEKKQYAL